MPNPLENLVIKALKPFFNEESPGHLYQLGAKPPSVRRMEQMLKTHRLADLLPHEVYDEEHSLFINSDSYGFAIEMTTAVGLSESTLDVLSGLFTGDNIERDTVIQVILYASPDVMPELARWANAVHADTPDANDLDDSRPRRNDNIFRRMARARVEHVLKGCWRSMSPHTSMMTRDFRAFITFQRPLPEGKSENLTALMKRKMKSRTAQILSTLSTAGLSGRVMDAEQLINLLDTMINARTIRREDRAYDDSELVRDQVVAKENLLLVGRDDLYLHNPDRETHLSLFGVDTYDKYWAGWNNGELIGSLYEEALRISTPFMITVTVRCPDPLEQAGQARLNLNRAVQMSESPIAKTVPGWHDKRREWEFVVRKIDEGHTNLQVNYQIVLFSDKDNTEAAEKQLETTFKANKWRLYKLRHVLLPAFIMALPLGASQTYVRFAYDKKLFKTLPSWSIVNICPWIAEWKGTRNPLQLLYGYRGQVTHFNPWDNQDGNFNMAIAARPGSGKSFWLQDLLLCVLGQGGRAWVFDRGRSFEPLCRLLGEHYSTQFIDFDASNRLSLNPFTHVVSWEGDKDGGSERVMIHSLLVQMATSDQPLPPERQTWLDVALQAVWERKGRDAEITDIYDELYTREDVRYQDLADALYPFTRRGVFGDYFCGPSTIDLRDDFVVLEMKELDQTPQLQTIVLLILMMRIEQTMYSPKREQRKQVCLIDEAWKLLRHGNASTFVEEGYRTARKYNGAFVTITQGVNDYYRNPTTQACLENSDWTLLLAQRDESIKQLAKSDRLPGGEESIKLIRKLRLMKGLYSSCAVIGPGGLTVARLIVDKFSEMLFTTNSNEIAERQALMASGLSMSEAIEHMAEERMRHD